MHEMSICLSILESLEEQARNNSYKRINTLWLEVGPFSGVEIKALEFSFDAVVKDTILSRCQLIIVETEGLAWCFTCNEQVIIKNRFDNCLKCRGSQLTVIGGEELKIQKISVEE